ncbi:MAG: PAS domain S-box protein [Candidatus Hydrogenedentes bacterium]|nr:PAS domain S-box protein [Candidatus Hydrogenedentota bacterium]
MTPHDHHNAGDLAALAQAMTAFTQATSTMEEAYRRLQERVQNLDRELAEKNRRLEFTTEYLSNLLESISDGFVAVDAANVITHFNRAAAVILGYAPEEMIGRGFTEAFGRDFLQPAIPGVTHLRAKSGRLVPVNERNSPVSDRRRRRLGYAKTFQDLSEIIALREQMRQVDRLAAIGEMAASVAHEIRNPLGGIRGFAALLARDLARDDARRRLVEKIIAGAESLDKVVNELLEYTRPVALRLRPASCAEIVDAAIAFVETEPKGIILRNAVDPALKILGDPERLRQVFLNILLNAVQSIEDAGETRVYAEADERFVTVVVEDTGCGMTREQRERMFSPFYTTKEKGTGLGLAVSLKIVEAHGGAIDAASEPGRGTAVSVMLPRAE